MTHIGLHRPRRSTVVMRPHSTSDSSDSAEVAFNHTSTDRRRRHPRRATEHTREDRRSHSITRLNKSGHIPAIFDTASWPRPSPTSILAPLPVRNHAAHAVTHRSKSRSFRMSQLDLDVCSVEPQR
jgi:hypothetical protein